MRSYRHGKASHLLLLQEKAYCPDKSGQIRILAGYSRSLGFYKSREIESGRMMFYYTVAKENATLTAHHFDISRKTFSKRFKRFEESKHNVESLADGSRAPHHKRRWEITLIQEDRIRQLRKRYPDYGKKKLRYSMRKNIMRGLRLEDRGVIRKHRSYPDKRKAEKVLLKSKLQRITPRWTDSTRP